jgi:hypothetical protein
MTVKKQEVDDVSNDRRASESLLVGLCHDERAPEASGFFDVLEGRIDLCGSWGMRKGGASPAGLDCTRLSVLVQVVSAPISSCSSASSHTNVTSPPTTSYGIGN